MKNDCKYKVGDVVIVRPDLRAGRFYTMSGGGQKQWCNSEMAKLKCFLT